MEKAIRISPEYAEAYINLAVQHIRMGEFDRAVAELNRAIAIAGPGALQLCNLAYAQYRLQRFDEAAESARAALRVDSGYAQAHLIPGVVLARDWRTLADSLPHLERAARTMPAAASLLQAARNDCARAAALAAKVYR